MLGLDILPLVFYFGVVSFNEIRYTEFAILLLKNYNLVHINFDKTFSAIFGSKTKLTSTNYM